MLYLDKRSSRCISAAWQYNGNQIMKHRY